MEFPYEELWYLKARGPDDKRPAETWGGYNQVFEDASCVYSHAEVVDSEWKYWLINGIQNTPRMKRQLLVFDLDIYKAPSGFDPARVTTPDETPLVKSQRGGFHVPFVVNTSFRGSESDFMVVEELPFDIDIRGEFVKAHVVAPSSISGVSDQTGYELVHDSSIMHMFDPEDAAKRILFDGEPAVKYQPEGRSMGGGYERTEFDPPAVFPTCYSAGLSLRGEAPDDPDLNTHKVNVLAALFELAGGYSVESVVEHFVEKFYPGEPGYADRDVTEYQVAHLAGKLDSEEYSPPSVRTLREYGILPVDESCSCGIGDHTEEAADESEGVSPYYSFDVDSSGGPRAVLAACVALRAEHPELASEKPPYRALVGVAEVVGLSFEDPDEKILGRSSYAVARRVFDELSPEDFVDPSLVNS